MSDIQKIQITSSSVPLSVLAVGKPQQPCVIMVHGLRDTAHSLLPIAAALSQPSAQHAGFYVMISELRGHGESGRSDGYSMANFLADLHCVVHAAPQQPCALFGHSLGGHLVSRYAALYPQEVSALVMVEGLGPPRRQAEAGDEELIENYRNMLNSRVLAQLNKPPSKPLTDVDEVSRRLQRNNPRLAPQLAQQIAPHLVTATNDGLRWAFDARASGVFLGTSEDENTRFWRHINAPTCLISGTLSYEYWGREMAATGFTGHFAEGEMEARLAQFKQAQHHWFDRSGHMVHYDEPQRLAATTRNFLEEHHG